MRRVLRAIGRLLLYPTARVAAWFLYEPKYLRGPGFRNRYGSVFAEGWRWVLADLFGRWFLHVNAGVPWPVSPQVRVGNPGNLAFDPDDLVNFQSPGGYFQCIGAEVRIGRGCRIAPNCGFITANHDLSDLLRHDAGKPIVLGASCWIGMNSMILPGVTLGERTIVGAGSVVTHSFPEGGCVIAGNPARLIRRLEERAP